VKTFFNFIRNMEGQALVNPCDNAYSERPSDAQEAGNGPSWKKIPLKKLFSKPTIPETGLRWN
jgi:hypothetical protein